MVAVFANVFEKYLFCLSNSKNARLFSPFRDVKMAHFQPANSATDVQCYFQLDQRVKMTA